MSLTEECKSKLDGWLSFPATGDLSDWERWFDFVDQYSRDCGFALNEAEVKEYLHASEKKLNGDIGETFEASIERHITAARHILEFLRYTDR